MVKTRSMTRKQNLDNVFSKKRSKNCDKCDVTPWSDLNQDVLFLVMMRLGVVDFVAFGGVCKSWRSLALPNRNMFMASKPPMSMSISTRDNKIECYLKDFEGRNFKTILAHSGDWTFVGYTCGYLIFNEMKTNDIWLVNLITRHELHFPPGPYLYDSVLLVSPLLVFSTSISRWVFVFLDIFSCEIWCCIEGKGGWSHLSSTSPIHDIHAFKGKIYTINEDFHISEMRLNPEPNLTLLNTKNFSKQHFSLPRFINLGESLYVMESIPLDPCMVYEVDFGEMKLVSFEETRDECAFFCSILNMKFILINKRELWVDLLSQYGRYAAFGSGKRRFLGAKLWYFPHECLKVDILNE